MELKKFSSENILNIQELTLHYLFFTNHFSMHYEIVSQFQDFHEVAVVNPSNVYCYLNLLNNQRLFSPFVLNNGYSYVQKERELIENLPKEEKQKQNDYINHIIYVLQLYNQGLKKREELQEVFTKDSFLRNVLENYQFLKEEKRNRFFEELFLTTMMLLKANPNNPDDENLDVFFWNPAFLDYCKEILDSTPALFLEPDFFTVISSILELNRNPEGFSNPSAKKTFINQNKKISRQLHKVVS